MTIHRTSANSPPASSTSARMPMIGRIGWLRGALGAGLAILLTGWVSQLVLAGHPALPWLLAPIGASAVLVFVLPASPLSQPWPVWGGQLLSGAIGLIAHGLIPLPWLAAGLAVGASIAAMSMARCLHPPAGGTALVTALAGPAVADSGWAFLFAPLLLNVVLLLVAGFTWNRLTGHSYPHRPAPIPTPAGWVGHIEDQDLDAVLESWDETLDISREDLLALLHAVEAKVRVRAGVR